MKYFHSFLFLIFFSLITSCSKDEEKKTVLKEKNLESQMIEV